MVEIKSKEGNSEIKKLKKEKLNGVVYTPTLLAEFVAKKIIENIQLNEKKVLKVLDPAIGDGELVLALLEQLIKKFANIEVDVYGFDTDENALNVAKKRIVERFPSVNIFMRHEDFVGFVVNLDSCLLLEENSERFFDIIIANPPYVRTQLLSVPQRRLLSKVLGLKGKVDLYHAFLIGISKVLAENGTVGIIVSNRFMTVKGGLGLRERLQKEFNIIHVFDLGDTKIFDVSVLPAIIVAKGKNFSKDFIPKFTSIYEVVTGSKNRRVVKNVIEALDYDGEVLLMDGRSFFVRHGNLKFPEKEKSVWVLSNAEIDKWLLRVKEFTWCEFGDIGKVRVGVKTCADKIFIRSDWNDMIVSERPELLRKVSTHHCAGRFRGKLATEERYILYPHVVVNGNRKAVDLDKYPNAKKYLNSYRDELSKRDYLISAGRRWYELWVPHDPIVWNKPKIIFRDIAEKPCFWIDLDGCIVNGDCYWMCADSGDMDLLWLACAVANSSFIEEFYDKKFNNKLYSGKRRFITQYVAKFPLPNPKFDLSRRIIQLAKDIYCENHSLKTCALEKEMDDLVYSSFGLL